MCVCLFSALSRRVGALHISIIIIQELTTAYDDNDDDDRNLYSSAYSRFFVWLLEVSFSQTRPQTDCCVFISFVPFMCIGLVSPCGELPCLQSY